MESNPGSPTRFAPSADQIAQLMEQAAITRHTLQQQDCCCLYFEGVFQKRAGNFTLKDPWIERSILLASYTLRENDMPRAQSVKVSPPIQRAVSSLPHAECLLKQLVSPAICQITAAFYFDVVDGDPHCEASMTTPMKGYFDLSVYCNAKNRLLGNPDHRYMTLIPCPQQPGELKELRVRAVKSDRAGCRNLAAFRDCCIEHCRQNNPTSHLYQRTFDRELFLDKESNFVPHELLRYAKHYLQQLADPTDSGYSSLLALLQAQLDFILSSRKGPDDEECIRAAKTVTGFAAAVARRIFCEDEPDELWEPEWCHLQALQEYQVRQLVELALFCGPDTPKDTDRTIGRFVHWARPFVAGMQKKIDQRLPSFAASEARMQLDDFWAAKLRKVCGDRFATLQNLYGLLTPALQMILAMESCTTPVQKVRIWAEAIVEAISLVNTMLGADGIGGPDVPSLVLFLTCTNECQQLYVEASLARMFCLDNYGQDEQDYSLPSGGLYSDLAEQYAFQAEKRAIDHQHYLFWVQDTLHIVAESAPTPNATPDSASEREIDLTNFELDEDDFARASEENVLTREMLRLDECWSQEHAASDPSMQTTWVSVDLRQLLQSAYERYDVHTSSNPTEEFRQLCTSLGGRGCACQVVHLDLDLEVHDIDALVETAAVEEDLERWNLETFITWFLHPDNFGASPEWCVDDASSDEHDGSDVLAAWLRAGSYRGSMCSNDGRTRSIDFKIRLREGSNTQLFDRLYNDEALGRSDTQEPLGLYRVTGMLDNAASTIRFTKSYITSHARGVALQQATAPEPAVTAHTEEASSGNLGRLGVHDLFQFDGRQGDTCDQVVGTFNLCEAFSGSFDNVASLLNKLDIGECGTFAMKKVVKFGPN